MVFAAAQWLILVLLARFRGPAELGQFALAIAITAPASLLLGLQLRGYQVTDASGEYTDREYLRLRTLTSLAGLIAIAGLAALAYQRTTALVIAGVGAIKAVESISDICHGTLHRREQLKSVSIAFMWRGGLGLMAVAGVLLAGGDVVSAVYAKLCTSVVMLGYDMLLIRGITGMTSNTAVPHGWISRAGRLAGSAAPLGAAVFIMSLNTNLPLYVLDAHAGSYDTGIYSALAAFIAVGSTLIMALGQSAAPRLGRYAAVEDRIAFNRLLRRMLVIAAGVGVSGVAVAALAGGPLLQVIYGTSYATHAATLVTVMVAGLAGYLAAMYRQAFVALRWLRLQVGILLASCLSIGVAALLLVPRYGLQGAAAALAVGLTIQLGMFMIAFRFGARASTGPSV